MKEEEEEQYIPGVEQPQPVMYQDHRILDAVLDNKFSLDELTKTLQGQLLNSISNKFENTGVPLVNDRALSWIVGRLHTYTSKIFSLTNFNQAVIRSMAYEFEKEIISELMFPNDWGVEVQNRDYIRAILADTMTATLYKAESAITLSKLLEQHHITETNLKQEEVNKGLFARFKL